MLRSIVFHAEDDAVSESIPPITRAAMPPSLIMSLPPTPVRNSLCEEFREVSGSILGSARFLNTLQDAIVGHQDVPYLVRLGFIDFILSLLRRFKEEEISRDNVLSSIRFETWSYLTTSFLRNSHGNIYHCRYLELLLFVLDYEHEDALKLLLEKCKIVDLFLGVYKDDDDNRSKVCTSRTDAKGHVLRFFQNLRASPLSKPFLKSRKFGLNSQFHITRFFSRCNCHN